MLDSTPPASASAAVRAVAVPAGLRRRPPRRHIVPAVAAALLILVAAASAHAQDAFAGGGIALEDVVIPAVSLQAGGIVAPHVEMRASIDAFALVVDFVDAGGDVLYTSAPASGPVWYAGGGPDLYYTSIGTVSPQLTGGIHLTGGVELPVGPTTGIYLELKPGVPFTFRGVLVATRFGVNVHF